MNIESFRIQTSKELFPIKTDQEKSKQTIIKPNFIKFEVKSIKSESIFNYNIISDKKELTINILSRSNSIVGSHYACIKMDDEFIDRCLVVDLKLKICEQQLISLISAAKYLGCNCLMVPKDLAL
jgi:hypothetical protein